MYLSIVKRLLQLDVTDSSSDELIMTIIELVLAKVKAICNIKNSNPVLNDYDFSLLVSQIVVDVYESYSPAINANEEEDNSEQNNGSVKAITIGDYKVEYNAPATVASYKTSSLSSSVHYHLDKYDEELVNYRYIKFF